MHKKLIWPLCLLLAARPAFAATCATEPAGNTSSNVVVYNSPSGSNSTGPVTTTQSNEPIFVTFFVSAEQTSGPAPTVTAISGGGVTFTRRAQSSSLITSCYGSPGQTCYMAFEVWEGEASAPLTGQTFSVAATTGSATGGILAAFGVTNTSTPSAPFDPNGSLPATSTNFNGTPAVPTVPGVSTNNANDLLLQFCGTVNNQGTYSCNSQVNTGWNLTAAGAFLNSFIAYQIGSGVLYKTVSATQSGVTLDGVASVSGGPSPTVIANWIQFGDAVECGTPSPPPTGAIPHVWVNE
jgi:hypothetical protein